MFDKVSIKNLLNILVTGVPLLEKTDLLEQHQYAGFACQLFCQITSDKISLYFISKK